MATKPVGILCRAVRWRLLLKYLGMFGVALAGLNAVPFFAALALGESRLAGPYALVVIVLLPAALPLVRRVASERLQQNEALVLVALAFLFGSLAMSDPLGAASDSWLDGWFEAVSGITTTGLSAAVTVQNRPPSCLRAAAPRHSVIDTRLGERRTVDDDLLRTMPIMLFFASRVFLS